MVGCGAGATGALVSTLVAFRNYISHSRYFEARTLLSAVKNGLCLVATLVVSCSPDAIEEHVDGPAAGRDKTLGGETAALQGRRAEFMRCTRSLCHMLQVACMRVCVTMMSVAVTVRSDRLVGFACTD